MRYVLSFGTANAGGTPTFTLYKRLDTLANLTQPTITEIASGDYYFEVDWSTVGVDEITFIATLNGIELADVISGVLPASTSTAVAASTSTSGFKSAQAIINQAAIELGIAVGPLSGLSDPFASTDPNIQQLIGFTNQLGQELNSDNDFPYFIKEFTITTAGSATLYALPADYGRMSDQSGWNRSTRLPIMGPLSSQEVQYLKSRLSGVLINVAARQKGNMLEFPIAPANGQSLYGEYFSTYWVQSAASGTGPDADSINLGTDIVLFDNRLMVAGIKLRWSEAKGFDTSVLAELYEKRLESYTGNVFGGKMLHMGGAGINPDHLLDTSNIPVTGYAQ